MLQGDNIKIMLFAILCICFVFYLFLGIYSYKKDTKSKVNIMFMILSISASLWAIGYALMLISPNVQIANIWRIVAGLGWCFFNGIWVSFALSLSDTKQKNFNPRIQFSMYIVLIICFIRSLFYEPSKVVSSETYGFIDNIYTTTSIGTVFSIYIAILAILGIVIIYFSRRNSSKNRVRKQMKIILITGFISFCLTAMSDVVLPSMNIIVFPAGVIAISVGMGGMWYAINKYKMMSISYELVSEYLFEAINEPIFLLGEDLIVKNCNEAVLNATSYNYKYLEGSSLNAIINFRDFNFNSIMQTGNVINIEVDLLRENKESFICELSATVIYDEYKDVLGILTQLHDVSERKKIEVIQKKYTLELEESNLKLKKEIKNRLRAEEQIRHFVYYDSLTRLFNRKKMREDVSILLHNKSEKFALLFIDLDKFKSANDNYGHQAGDYILKTVAVRLKNIIRPTDIVYRIGGDEFIIIMRDLKVIADAEKIAIAAVETLSSAFIYKENQLFIGSSIGISVFPEHGIDQDTLSTKADLAMYEAKRNGGNGYKMYSKVRRFVDPPSTHEDREQNVVDLQ